MKNCNKCGVELTEGNRIVSRVSKQTGKELYRSRCKTCHANDMRSYRKNYMSTIPDRECDVCGKFKKGTSFNSIVNPTCEICLKKRRKGMSDDEIKKDAGKVGRPKPKKSTVNKKEINSAELNQIKKDKISIESRELRIKQEQYMLERIDRVANDESSFGRKSSNYGIVRKNTEKENKMIEEFLSKRSA
jgi:hypothetical protein